MSKKYFKFPRTPHFPSSPGFGGDDILLSNFDNFTGNEIVIAEKLDGENLTMYFDYIHARSIDSRHHESRSWVKNFHSTIKHLIPNGFRICGENVFAKHSIYYPCLTSYFYCFAIYNNDNICVSWDKTCSMANSIGIKTVPVLYRGIWNPIIISNLESQYQKSKFGPEREGFVVRLSKEFHYNDHGKCVAKWVRKGHVQSNGHWMSKLVEKNDLAKKELVF